MMVISLTLCLHTSHLFLSPKPLCAHDIWKYYIIIIIIMMRMKRMKRVSERKISAGKRRTTTWRHWVWERERKIEEDDHFSIIYILACKLVIWTISVILQCYRNTLAFFTKIFKLHPTYSHYLILLQRIIVMMTLKDKHFFLHT